MLIPQVQQFKPIFNPNLFSDFVEINIHRAWRDFQYFRNIKDEDLEMFARTFTFLQADAIAELCNSKVTAINSASSPELGTTGHSRTVMTAQS